MYVTPALLCLQLIWITALQLLNSQQHVGVGKKEQETLDTALTGQAPQTSSLRTYSHRHAVLTLPARAVTLVGY